MILILLSILFWLIFLSCLNRKIRGKIFNIFNITNFKLDDHLKGLDGIRGLAALWVAIFHLWQWNQPTLDYLSNNLAIITLGNKALPIFVSLSGLLTFRSFERILNNNQDFIFALKQFFLNRFYRIYPLYFFTSCLSLFIFFRYHFNNESFNLRFFLDRILGEFMMLRIIGWQGMANPTSWSLYVEVAFYFIAPFIFLLFTKRKILICLVVFFILNVSEIDCIREFALWKYFPLGILAGQIIKKNLVMNYQASIFSLIGLGVFASDIYFQLASNRFNTNNCPIEYTLLLSFSILILLISIPNAKLFNNFFELSPLRFLGRISYSLYLVHSIFIALTFNLSFDGSGGLINQNVDGNHYSILSIFIVIIPALLFCSSVSFLLIEKPFQILKN